MRVLLDTCVLSEIRRPRGNQGVREFVESLDPDEIFLSVVTDGELAKGIALLTAGAKQQQLSFWLTGIEQHYADKILPIDLPTSRLWGELTARAQTAGVQVPLSDGLIAATALRYGLHVVTRTTRDFAATGVLVIDPWN